MRKTSALPRSLAKLLAAAAAALAACAAHADITIGVSLPLTGPASGLGIPVKNGIALWPQSIGGEPVRLIMLDDATDPTVGVKNARRFVSEDNVDVIVGSAATPVGVAMADVAAEAKTVQLSMSPIPLPEGRDAWSFRVPHSSAVMAHAVIEHMKKNGVKTVGFIGYTDAYGETWLKDMTSQLAAAGIGLVATERFQRTDTSVTAQALKLVSANPDAILVVASGSGAAMPELTSSTAATRAASTRRMPPPRATSCAWAARRSTAPSWCRARPPWPSSCPMATPPSRMR